ncbi:MAG: hypothetical protein K0U72_06400 [Gammaproteobacteria bacterium]|nr:hypothetical protein [Gammaproteobacteria bacterium]
MKAAAVIFLGFVLSGCVTSSVEPALAADNRQVVCKMEKPTGSNRPVKVCRVAADALDHENTKRDMGVLQRQSDILSGPEKNP